MTKPSRVDVDRALSRAHRRAIAESLVQLRSYRGALLAYLAQAKRGDVKGLTEGTRQFAELQTAVSRAQEIARRHRGQTDDPAKQKPAVELDLEAAKREILDRLARLHREIEAEAAARQPDFRSRR